MLTVTEHHYSVDKADRWRGHPGAYLDHATIGEDPHRRQSTALVGDRWLPAGLPAEASLLSVRGRDGLHAFSPLADGAVIFGTGVACFAWTGLAVLDYLGQELWTAEVNLGVKGADDVWVVTFAADTAAPAPQPLPAAAKPKRTRKARTA